ncbi:uncharacterized protein [Narcine bancroftii]|uniref:uncharacterized protein n=1 Tax=Narcine bancroftii TaxID=1343680 RepID=UPI0038312C68
MQEVLTNRTLNECVYYTNGGGYLDHVLPLLHELTFCIAQFSRFSHDCLSIHDAQLQHCPPSSSPTTCMGKEEDEGCTTGGALQQPCPPCACLYRMPHTLVKPPVLTSSPLPPSSSFSFFLPPVSARAAARSGGSAESPGAGGRSCAKRTRRRQDESGEKEGAAALPRASPEAAAPLSRGPGSDSTSSGAGKVGREHRDGDERQGREASLSLSVSLCPRALRPSPPFPDAALQARALCKTTPPPPFQCTKHQADELAPSPSPSSLGRCPPEAQPDAWLPACPSQWRPSSGCSRSATAMIQGLALPNATVQNKIHRIALQNQFTPPPKNLNAEIFNMINKIPILNLKVWIELLEFAPNFMNPPPPPPLLERVRIVALGAGEGVAEGGWGRTRSAMRAPQPGLQRGTEPVASNTGGGTPFPSL